MDRADHDELGRHISRDDVCSDNARFLRPEVSAGSCRSRFFPGNDLLLEPVVSGGATCARDRRVYDSSARERCHRRPTLRRVAESEWNVRARWVAMAVFGRGTSCGVAWGDCAGLSHGSA